MSITKETVQHIAKLSSLAISDEQATNMQTDMNRILELVESIENVDTSNVSALAHPYNISQHLRADEVTEINRRDDFSKLTNFYESGHYLVPKVID
tara:strand:- start:147 stop:434 length:288 start_codon:yes stop_codon:yes gene_type:complete